MSKVKLSMLERDGVENNFGPEEANPASDLAELKGVAFEGSLSTTIEGNSGVMEFKDSEVVQKVTLQELLGDSTISNNLSVVQYTSPDIVIPNDSLFHTIFSAVGSGKFWMFNIEPSKKTMTYMLLIDGVDVFNSIDYEKLSETIFNDGKNPQQGNWFIADGTKAFNFSPPLPLKFTTGFELKVRRDGSGTHKIKEYIYSAEIV